MATTSLNGSDLLVSVVICNYNYGEFIGKAIESVVQQTHAALELVVYDDGSTDNSVAEISHAIAAHSKRFNRVLTICARDNKGKLYGLNEALPLVKGEAVVILDADDMLLNDYIETAAKLYVEARAKDKNIGIVYSDCELVDRDGKSLGGGSSEPFDPELLETQSYLPECALTKTKALLEHLPYDASIMKLTKHHKWLRLVRAGWTGVYMQQPGFCYRMHDANMSNIGNRVLTELKVGTRSERILSDYWETSAA